MHNHPMPMSCETPDRKLGRAERAVAAIARAIAPPISNGFSFYGPLGEKTYKACIDPRFWGTTGVPFSFNGPGKRVYVGVGEGIGSARAMIGGNKITMDRQFVGSQWEDNILAHEVGHICWLRHSLPKPDLMSNPVWPNDVTNENDRQRFVSAYRNHGGILKDSEPVEPVDPVEPDRPPRRRRRRCTFVRRLLGRC